MINPGEKTVIAGSSFADLEDEPMACHRAAGNVALRFPDPLGRRDASGRVIPHEFVVFGDLVNDIGSVEDGLRQVWPLVAEAYARVWDAERPPSVAGLRLTAENNPSRDAPRSASGDGCDDESVDPR